MDDNAFESFGLFCGVLSICLPEIVGTMLSPTR